MLLSWLYFHTNKNNEVHLHIQSFGNSDPLKFIYIYKYVGDSESAQITLPSVYLTIIMF